MVFHELSKFFEFYFFVWLSYFNYLSMAFLRDEKSNILKM